MTGTCKLCGELVFGPPVLTAGPDRQKLEFVAVSEAARAHVYGRHRDMLAVFGTLTQIVVMYLSSLFLDGQEELEAERAGMREGLLLQLQDAQVVVTLDPSAAAAAGANPPNLTPH